MSELLTVSEVARIFRVHDTSVRRWIKQGTLEAVTLPHVNARQAYRIKRSTLNKVLGNPTEQPPAPQPLSPLALPRRVASGR